MDRIEQTIRRKDEKLYAKDKFRYHLLFALAIAFGLVACGNIITVFYAVATLNMTTVAVSLVPLIVSGVLAIVFLFLKDEMLLEYDYIIEDDELIIAKIKNLKSRKEIVKVQTKSLKRMYPYNEKDFSLLEAKKVKATLNPDAERFVLICEQGERIAVVFEPNEEMQKMITKELNK